MILFLVLPISIFQFCEGFLTDIELNVIITKIDVDSFEEDKAVFEGMNNIVHEYFCEKLGKYRLYPFEPLPLPYEYFTVHNSSLPSSSTFQDIGTSSQHQNPSNLGTLANFMNSLTLDKQKTSKVVDIIKIGSNRREVSALPCTFNYYTIYVVPVIEFDGALLFLQNGSSSPMPLEYKRNVIISPLPESENETPDPLNLVKNLTLCTSLFHTLRIKFGKKQKLEVASMKYVELEIFNALRCYHTGNFVLNVYQLSEIPRVRLTLLMFPYKPEEPTNDMLYEVYPQSAMTRKSFYFKNF